MGCIWPGIYRRVVKELAITCLYPNDKSVPAEEHLATYVTEPPDGPSAEGSICCVCDMEGQYRKCVWLWDLSMHRMQDQVLAPPAKGLHRYVNWGWGVQGRERL